MIELEAGPATATIDEASGGRVGALVAHGVPILVDHSLVDDPMLWGSFPMVPWVGRLRHGRFEHDGAEHHLPPNLSGHALHGTAFVQPWERTDDGEDGAGAALTCPLDAPWPLGGRADQTITLTPTSLRCTLAVTADDRSMPAEIGWHPWFPTRGPVELPATAMYERDGEGLPTGRLVAPPPPPWDDCFVVARPVRFPVGPLQVTVSSDCDHVVVFDGLDIGIAVEPQSGPPDALNLHPRVLHPGEALTRTMTISWQDGPRTAVGYPSVTGGR
ncbi:MAG: aldose epimerase [Ilumatobacteraceae bacterium]